MDFDLRIISLGAGVQSTTMYRMAALGEIEPKPDYAIFADTKQEPYWVYDQLKELERDHGSDIPILICSRGDLGKDISEGVNSTGQSFASVPFWVAGDDGKYTPGRRQCTREYKVEVVYRSIRELLGLKIGEQAKHRYLVEMWVGISLDEAHRAKPSRWDWIKTRWPLLDTPKRRAECELWLDRHGFIVPRKSSCIFCPYRKAIDYARWREDEPELFEQACRWDEKIRYTGTSRAQYILKSLEPLHLVPPVHELQRTDPNQIDLFGNECEGMCGV